MQRVVNNYRTMICKQREIQSLDFLILFDQAKRMAKIILAQIEIFSSYELQLCFGGTKEYTQFDKLL